MSIDLSSFWVVAFVLVGCVRTSADAGIADGISDSFSDQAPNDAGLDEGIPADLSSSDRLVDAVGFCTTRPKATFCDDFDDPAPASDWDYWHAPFISFDSVATSPPAAAHIVLPPSKEACRFARFDKKHPIGSNSVRLEWAFWLGAKGQDPGFETGRIAQLVANGMPGVRLCALIFQPSLLGTSEIFEQNLTHDGQLTGIQHTFLEQLEGGRYYRAVLVMTLGASPMFTFSLDGNPVLLDVAMDPACAGAATDFETNMGFHCHDATMKTDEIRLDDIALFFL